MTAVLVAAGAWLMLAGVAAIWLGRIISRAAALPPRFPDTAEEFLERTR